MTAKRRLDAERQLRFQTEQAFINVLLAKSTLDLAQREPRRTSPTSSTSTASGVHAGDLAESRLLQNLAAEAAVRAGRLGGGGRARPGQGDAAADCSASTACRTTSTSTATWRTRTRRLDLDDLKRQALGDAARPAGRAERREARAGHADARAQQPRARRRAATWTTTHAGPANAFGFGVSIDLPFHDRNQGNIAHSEVAVAAGRPNPSCASRFAVVTDVVTAYAALQTSEKVVGALSVRLSRSGAAVARHHDLRLSARRRHAARSARRRAHLSRHAAGVPPGAGGLHDERAADQLRGRKAGDAMRQGVSSRPRSRSRSCWRRVAAPPRRAVARRARPPRRRPPRGRRSAGEAGLLHRAGRPAAAPADRRPSARATWSRRRFSTTGTVDWDNDHTTQAITQVSGPITRIRRRHRRAA